jgi:hypothetical protein
MTEYAFEFEYNDHDLDDLAIQDRNHEIKQLLLNHECEITFMKLNGELRSMPCTLKASALPERTVTESTKTRVAKPDTISAFCLDKNEWRSFKVANVTHVRVAGND